MKIILNLRRHDCLSRVGISLIAVALIVGMVGCGSGVVEYDLTISSTAGGSVATPGEGTSTYNEGEVVDLVAEPEEGYHFVNWTGDVSSIDDVNAASTTIIIDADKSLTANFTPLRCNLIIDSTDGGSVSTPGEGTSTYDYGTAIDLVATTDTDYQFVEWTGDVGTVADVHDASTTITMNGNCSITASFAIGIWDWYDLDAIRENLDISYILMNSLDSTSSGYTEHASPTANQGKGWKPIGGVGFWPELGVIIPVEPFTGCLDGGGYEISDLFISRPDQDGIGIFGSVDLAAIKSLGVTDANVTGHMYVGSLVGYAFAGNAVVSNSYSNGTVSGDHVGGLMGFNAGTVSNSYFSGNVNGGQYAGGLLGVNFGTVSKCYSTGRVAGDQYVGGLVAKNVEGTGTIRDSFWDTQTSGQAASAGGTGKNTAQMKNIATFSAAGWNIIAVATGERNTAYTWNIVDGQTYPFLSWQSTT